MKKGTRNNIILWSTISFVIVLFALPVFIDSKTSTEILSTYLVLFILVMACVAYSFVFNKYVIKNIICPNPNCGFKGPAQRKARGSTLIGFILLCFFILPGLIYFMFKSGYRYSCPKCGMQISVDN